MDKKSDNLYRTYHFSLHIIRFASTLPNQRIYWTLTDQLVRAATSIGANLTEAKASSSRKDFIKYYDIALKSANEVTYWLRLMIDSDLEFIDKDEAHNLLEEVEQICRMLGKSLLTLKGKV